MDIIRSYAIKNSPVNICFCAQEDYFSPEKCWTIKSLGSQKLVTSMFIVHSHLNLQRKLRGQSLFKLFAKNKKKRNIRYLILNIVFLKKLEQRRICETSCIILYITITTQPNLLTDIWNDTTWFLDSVLRLIQIKFLKNSYLRVFVKNLYALFFHFK